MQTVAVLGASDDPERYSNKAIKLLLKKGHTVIPVNPNKETIEKLVVKQSLNDIDVPVDTLTIYLSPKRSEDIVYDIVELKPRRVIFNPGTESDMIEQALEKECIAYHKACTLILLNTDTF